MDDIITGTGKWYISGRINLNEDIKKEVTYDNGQKLVVSFNKETQELCMKPLKY